MNKAELVAQVSERLHGSESDARAYVDAVFDVIMRQVAAGERVQVTGFGTFDGVQRAARAGRNPRTGAAIQIAAGVSPRFQPGQTFRAQVAGSAEEPVAVVVEEVAAVGAVAKKGAAKKDPAKKNAAKKGTAKKDTAKKDDAKAKKAEAKTKAKKAEAKKAPKSEKAGKGAKPVKAVKAAKAGKK